jgi:hypothetical protein
MEITNDLLRGFQVGLALEPTKSVAPSHSSLFLGVKGDTSGVHSPTAPRATFTPTLVRLANVLAVMRERKTAERILPSRQNLYRQAEFHLASLTWASNLVLVLSSLTQKLMSVGLQGARFSPPKPYNPV